MCILGGGRGVCGYEDTKGAREASIAEARFMKRSDRVKNLQIRSQQSTQQCVALFNELHLSLRGKSVNPAPVVKAAHTVRVAVRSHSPNTNGTSFVEMSRCGVTT